MVRRAFISLILKVYGNVNADVGVGIRIPMKKIITWDKKVKAFVSARCIRRAIREKLYEKGFDIDPLTIEEQLVDVGDPFKYVDDDLFGYLYPRETKSRAGPIKISPLIALRHTEIKVEFAARFPRLFVKGVKEAHPAPFEVEVAEWLGRMNVIVSDRVGVIMKKELRTDVANNYKKGLYSNVVMKEEKELIYLKPDVRRKRLRAFLEILLHEGWEFPRGTQSPSVPEYHYAVIVLSERFTPIFGFVDITDDGILDEELLQRGLRLYNSKLNKAYVIYYKDGKYASYEISQGSISLMEDKLDENKMNTIIDSIVNFIIP